MADGNETPPILIGTKNIAPTKVIEPERNRSTLGVKYINTDVYEKPTAICTSSLPFEAIKHSSDPSLSRKIFKTNVKRIETSLKTDVNLTRMGSTNLKKEASSWRDDEIVIPRFHSKVLNDESVFSLTPPMNSLPVYRFYSGEYKSQTSSSPTATEFLMKKRKSSMKNRAQLSLDELPSHLRATFPTAVNTVGFSRESFLYKSRTNTAPCRRSECSLYFEHQHPALESKRSTGRTTISSRGSGKPVITPFMQILNTLRNVHAVTIEIESNLKINPFDNVLIAMKYLKNMSQDLGFCISELEKASPNKSLAEMANVKFTKMLTSELDKDTAIKGHDNIKNFITGNFMVQIPTGEDEPRRRSAEGVRKNLSTSCSSDFEDSNQNQGGLLACSVPNTKPAMKIAKKFSRRASVKVKKSIQLTLSNAPHNHVDSPIPTCSGLGTSFPTTCDFSLEEKKHRRRSDLTSSTLTVSQKYPSSNLIIESPVFRDQDCKNKTCHTPSRARSYIQKFVNHRILDLDLFSNKAGCLTEYFADIDKWHGIDVREVQTMSNNKPLAAVTWAVLENRNLFTTFHLDKKKIASFLLHLDECYQDHH